MLLGHSDDNFKVVLLKCQNSFNYSHSCTEDSVSVTESIAKDWKPSGFEVSIERIGFDKPVVCSLERYQNYKYLN